jgi:hypothetical protein
MAQNFCRSGHFDFSPGQAIKYPTSTLRLNRVAAQAFRFTDSVGINAI